MRMLTCREIETRRCTAICTRRQPGLHCHRRRRRNVLSAALLILITDNLYCIVLHVCYRERVCRIINKLLYGLERITIK